ncbi:major facilitator superfamily domain-containing protein [Desarmillaria tabescens]|uniref:Major facilitator superfamily domain-containing protein n=1 Tax=Armillaria tabescens TaxID=1929756 RepID=A0AA39T4P3_ARMTA|nr:major facilitator superfamily domain-containing protein [Desarmillaria tabescens]KAK0464546.1 major facilitator superfamily domain-containing protein [Desarmillaria tabescens]
MRFQVPGPSSGSEVLSKQPSVVRADILRAACTKKTLAAAFVALAFITLFQTLKQYTTKVYQAYATSDFSKHSLLTTSDVLEKIITLVAYPITAKLSDVFGRTEGLALTIWFMVLGEIMKAASPNVQTWVAAGVFFTVGDVGFASLLNIFIADTTTLLNRGLWSTIPETIASIPSLNIGSIIGGAVLDGPYWRWGYGMWAIILPVAAAPLIIILVICQRKANRLTHTKPQSALDALFHDDPSTPTRAMKIWKLIWIELDFVGVLLLVVSLALILIPLTLTGTDSPQTWSSPGIIAMIVIGMVLFAVYIFYDAKIASKPLIPYRLARERTLVFACIIEMLDFLYYAAFTSFFPSFLQAIPQLITRRSNSLRVAYQVASPLWIGVEWCYYLGIPLMLLGQGLMIYFVSPGRETTAIEFCVTKIFIGIGRSFYMNAGQVGVQSLARRQDVAVAVAIILALTSLGGAIGSAISGAVWNNTLPSRLVENLPDDYKDQASTIFSSIKVAMKYARGTVVRDAIVLSYKQVQRILAIVAFAVMIPNLLFMFFIRDVKLSNDMTLADHEEDAGVESHKGVAASIAASDEKRSVEDVKN